MTENCDPLINHLSADAANAGPERGESCIGWSGTPAKVDGSEPLNLHFGSGCFVQVRYIAHLCAVLRIQTVSSARFALLHLLYAFSTRNVLRATERKCRYE